MITSVTPKNFFLPLGNSSSPPFCPQATTNLLQISFHFLEFYINVVIQQVFFFLIWFLSVNMLILRFIHVYSFLVLNNIPLYACSAIYPFTCWWTFEFPVSGYYKSALYIPEQVFVWTYAFTSLKSECLAVELVSMFNFLTNCQTKFFHSGCVILNSQSSV